MKITVKYEASKTYDYDTWDFTYQFPKNFLGI